MKKTIILIPAYNEEKNIGLVIDEIKSNIPESTILVIDDCSNDKTADLAKENGALIIRLPFNLGIGGAMQTGYKFAMEKGYDIAIQVDGDGQHDPSQIKFLMQPILNEKVNLVIGSRYLEKQKVYRAPFLRRIGSYVFSLVVYLLVGKKISDTTSGFRACDRGVIKFYASNYPQDYPEVEAITLLSKKGFSVVEVPVQMRPRKEGGSSITPIRSLYYMVKVFLALLIGIFRNIKDNPK